MVGWLPPAVPVSHLAHARGKGQDISTATGTSFHQGDEHAERCGSLEEAATVWGTPQAGLAQASAAAFHSHVAHGHQGGSQGSSLTHSDRGRGCPCVRGGLGEDRPRRVPERVSVPALPAGGGRGGHKMAAASRVFAFRDARWAPDPVLEPGAAVRTPQPVPLVIDNGSFQTRAGWASPDPAVPAEPLLRFRSLAARSRGARGGAGAETQVGNDLGSPEPLRWLLRSPFDRNVPVQLELQELLFDHVFQRLGVASQVPPGGEVAGRRWAGALRPPVRPGPALRGSWVEGEVMLGVWWE